MKKKLLAVLLAGVLTVGTAGVPQFALTARAETTDSEPKTVKSTDGKWEYYVDSDTGTVSISKYLGTEKAVDIPAELDDKTVTAVNKGAFNSDITSITISNNIKDISFDTTTSSLEEIIVAEKNESYSAKDGVLFNFDKTALVKYPPAKEGTAYNVPNGTTSILTNAFYGCKNLESVTVPSSVTELREVFGGDCSLKEVKVDEENANYYSEDGVVFEDKPLLREIGLLYYPPQKADTTYVIPDGVYYVVAGIFEYCDNLTSVTIPTSIYKICEDFFENTENISLIYEGTKEQWGKIDYAKGPLSEHEGYDELVTFAGSTTATFVDYNDEASGICVSVNKDEFTEEVKLVVTPVDEYTNGTNTFAYDIQFVSAADPAKRIYPKDAWVKFPIPDALANYATVNIYQLDSELPPIDMKFEFETDKQGNRFFYFGTDYLTGYMIEGDKLSGGSSSSSSSGSSSSTTTPEPTEYTDAENETGVTASADEGVLPDGAELVVTPVTSETSDSEITYDISFKDTDGKEVQPKGDVTVKVPVPEKFKDAEKVYVYRAETDGTYTDMKAEIKDGFVVFTTNHFSKYIVTTEEIKAETPAPETPKPTDTTPADTTTNPNTGVAVALIPAILAGAVVIVSAKKRK